jgi:hypothetical protein
MFDDRVCDLENSNVLKNLKYQKILGIGIVGEELKQIESS